MRLSLHFLRNSLSASLLALLAACAGGPPLPDWQMNAKGALDRAVGAYLAGNVLVENQEFKRARDEIASTGRLDLLARVELVRCATRVASLVLENCDGFEQLRADAAPAERAYADFLAGRAQPSDLASLPAQYRAVASVSSDAASSAALQGVSDPRSKLVAAGVLFRTNHATPAVLTSAVETASAQGWRRPLLAWLGVQALRAEQAGDAQAAQGLRRRIEFVQNPSAAAKP
jgi:hypothetical protein